MKIGVTKLGDETDDFDDLDADALVQAYVNIVTGACISIGKSVQKFVHVDS